MGELRYHCNDFREDGNANHHTHAHFRARMVPPRMEFATHDYTTWATWSLGIQAYNFQSRTSLRTLRNSEARAMIRGVNCRWEVPLDRADGMPLYYGAFNHARCGS